MVEILWGHRIAPQISISEIQAFLDWTAAQSLFKFRHPTLKPTPVWLKTALPMIATHRFFRFLLAPLLAGGISAHAATIATNAAANLVLGQSTFTTNATSSPATPSSLTTPSGVAVDPLSGKVFVADQGNNRVLRYASRSALKSGATPEVVFGQVNFSGSAANMGLANPAQDSLSSPQDVFVDAAGRLWIADTGNNRVVMFENAANLFNAPFADRVYGQPNFVTAIPLATATALAGPRGLCVDPAGTLWVADTGSHRVLAWKLAATLANGTAASRVLGQSLFTTAVAATSQTGMFNPSDVAADASNVWVADSDNNRVLLYPNFPTITGAPASLVLGQTTYATSVPATSAIGMTRPTSVATSGTGLWVCDDGNNRVLLFNSANTLANGAKAAVVVGQTTFTAGVSGLSSQKLSLFYSHISVDASGSLWVADRLNNRVLRFGASAAAPVASPTVAVKGKKSITTTRETYTLRGTASAGGGVLRVSYNQNAQGYLRARGTTSWRAKLELDPGRNKIFVVSVATDGTVSAPVKVVIFRE
jgi:DNA-binding beta-propeller fold protein YncE